MNRPAIFLCVAAIAATALPAASPGPTRLAYIREFKGSIPEYMAIEIDANGRGLYKEAIKDDYPIPFELDPAEWADIQAAAARIDACKRPLESGLKVAHMGWKTFRCYPSGAGGGDPVEVKFNFTQDVAGRALQDWFEKIAESATRYLALERAVKFEKLGVNQELLLLQAAGERNRLVGLTMYLPLLDRIIKNDTYMHMARERAAEIADIIRARKAAAGAPAPKAN